MLYPFILGTESFGHVVVIVLVGVMVTECVVCWRNTHMHTTPALLLAGSLALAAWVLIEYFAQLAEGWYHVLVHLPAVLVVSYVFWRLTRIKDKIARFLIFIFAVAILGHVALDVYDMFSGMTNMALMELLREPLQLTEILTFYFFAMREVIRFDYEMHT